jgi:hypothetical protein
MGTATRDTATGRSATKRGGRRCEEPINDPVGKVIATTCTEEGEKASTAFVGGIAVDSTTTAAVHSSKKGSPKETNVSKTSIEGSPKHKNEKIAPIGGVVVETVVATTAIVPTASLPVSFSEEEVKASVQDQMNLFEPLKGDESSECPGSFHMMELEWH